MQALRPDVARIAEWGGDAGRQWVTALPERLETLAARWELTLGSPYANGYCSYATPVTLSNGAAAVLKLPFLDGENVAEPRALHTYGGDGAVRLLSYDAATGAMLLERADPGTSLKAHPDRVEAVRIACELITRLRRPLTVATGDLAAIPDPPHGTEMAAGIAVSLRSHQGALPQALTAAAIEWADRLADAPEGSELLVNRDAHLDNIRAAEREPWLLIDPKPLVGEAALDAGWLLIDLLTDGPTRALADEWAPRVASDLGLDETRVRGWSLVRAMENAAWEASRGEDPSEDLAFAAAVALVV